MDSLLNVTPASLLSHCVGDAPEETRMVFLKQQLGILQRMRSREELNRVMNETAARHLPELFEAFKKSPNVHNPVLVLANTMSHTPYYGKFLRTPAGAELLALHIQRTLAADITKDTYDADAVGELGQFLSSALAVVGPASVGAEERRALVPKLRAMMRMYPGRLAETANERCYLALTGDREMLQMMEGMREMLGGALERCGAHGCTKKGAANLKQCSKCKTAAYCSPDHQRKAWPAHKGACFPCAF